MSFMSDAVVATYNAARALGGEQVVYTSECSGSDLNLVVLPGRTSAEQDVGEYGVIESETTDWLVLASELGTGVLPRQGDELRTTDGRLFRVLSDGQQPWRYNDQYRKVIRVHTKLVQVD